MKIVSLTIIRNEEKRYLLKPFLSSLNRNVDEIYIYDDCSDDKTVELCRNGGRKINIAVGVERMLYKDERILRQRAWDFTRQYLHENDWVIVIDADELILDEDYATMKKAINNHNLFWISAPFYHIWRPGFYRTDGNWQPRPIVPRIFRFINEPKQDILQRHYFPDYVLKKDGIRMTDIRFVHLGYMKDDDKKSKYQRYSTDAQNLKQAHQASHIESIISPNPSLQPFPNWINVERQL